VAGRSGKNLDRILEETSAVRLERDRHAAEPVPRSFEEVAFALREHRAVFEEGGIFPPLLIDRTLEMLATL
jgi:hypothetical protein